MPIVGPLASDFVSNATTSTNESVPGMNFPVAAGHVYWFEFQVPVTVAATTTGIELAVDIPAVTWSAIDSSIMTTTTDESQGTATDDAGRVFTDTAVAAGTKGVVSGFIKPSAAGEVQLRIDTDAAAAATVKAGCFGTWRDCGVV